MAGRACLQALRLRHGASALILNGNGAAVAQLPTTSSNSRVHQFRTFGPSVTDDDGSKIRAPNVVELFNCASRDDFYGNARRWMSSGRFFDDNRSPLWPSKRGIGQELGAGRDVDEVVEEPPPLWLSQQGVDGDLVEDVEVEGDIAETPPPPSALDSMFEGVPRRRRRFMMQKALKIKAEGEDEERASRRGFEMKVIDVNRTVKVTKGGKVQSFSALVITGNREGVVGFGKGKSSEIGPAIDKASLKALNNLHYFERFQGHTIFHEHDAKFEKTKIYLWPGRSGTGMRASHTVGGILRLAGFKNVKSKVVGSRHPLNTVKAVFKTLSEIESPEEVGERRSRIVVESHLVNDS